MPDTVETMEEGGLPAAGGKKKLKKVAAHTPMEMLSGAIAAVAVATSIAAMVVTPFAPVFVAGVLSAAIGPYAYWQQRRLTDVTALKETNEAIGREVDRLRGENARLGEAVDELTETVDRLEDVEDALEELTGVQGQSIEAFAEQVEESRRILGDMRKNLRANVLQNLLHVVLGSDQDGNDQIEADEIDDLIVRIQKINGVEVREDRFKQHIVSSGGSLAAVMDVIRNLMSDDVAKEDKIFIIKDDD